MCLDRVFSIDFSREGEGYKVFRVFNSRGWPDIDVKHPALLGEYFTQSRERPVGKWLKSEDYQMSIEGEDRKGEAPRLVVAFNKKETYEAGWHIFKYRQDAVEWVGNYHSRGTKVIRKVKYRNAVSIGDQNGMMVVVAKEMYICKEAVCV